MKFLRLNNFVIFNIFVLFVQAHDFVAERDVLFLLRVRNRPFNEEEIFMYENRGDVKNSAFDPSKATTFLAHGFLENSSTMQHLRLSK